MSDLISRRFGRLTVIDFAGTKTTPCGTKRKMWKCRCDCGNETIVNTSNLKNGSTKSCGCWKYSKIKKYNTKHGGSHDRLYGIWKNMKRRCNSPNDKHYDTYGKKELKSAKNGMTVIRFLKNGHMQTDMMIQPSSRNAHLIVLIMMGIMSRVIVGGLIGLRKQITHLRITMSN